MSQQNVPGATKERIRPFTWFIIAINIVIVITSIVVYTDYSSACSDFSGGGSCPTGPGLFTFMFLDAVVLAFANVALGVLWFVTRRRRVPGQATTAPGTSQPQWVVDPNNPDVLRWWDGRQYTQHSTTRQDWRG